MVEPQRGRSKMAGRCMLTSQTNLATPAESRALEDVIITFAHASGISVSADSSSAGAGASGAAAAVSSSVGMRPEKNSLILAKTSSVLHRRAQLVSRNSGEHLHVSTV